VRDVRLVQPSGRLLNSRELHCLGLEIWVLDLMETLALRRAALVVVTHDRAVAGRAGQEIALAPDRSQTYACHYEPADDV
jgi:hypothetical protein